MGLKGRTLDIALNQTLAKDVPGFNRVAPVMLDQRNVRLDDLGNLVKRPGYLEEWDTAVDEPIKLLIPEGTGYAIDRAGNFFTLGTTPNNIFSSAPINLRPTWIKYNGELIIATGTPLIAIKGSQVSLVGNNVPAAKFVVLINDYAIYLGYHPTEFTSAVPNNPKSVDTSAGARTYNIQKSGTIQGAIDYNENLIIFEEKEIEIWSFRGGDPPFVRHVGAKIETTGLGAPASIVKASNRIWWFGSDGDFHMLSGFQENIISKNMRAEIDKSVDPSAWEGYHINKEGLIMWINRNSGHTLMFDINKEKWLEDNWWNGGCWESLPFSAYMELDNKQYFGSAKYDGLIHDWSYDHKDDNGIPIRRKTEMIVSLSQQGFRGRVHRLNFRREANLATSTTTAPVFMARVAFDDKPYGMYKHLTLGVAGDNVSHAIMRRLGVGREMKLEIIQTDPVDINLTNIYATVERMAS